MNVRKWTYGKDDNYVFIMFFIQDSIFGSRLDQFNLKLTYTFFYYEKFRLGETHALRLGKSPTSARIIQNSNLNHS